ncbi:MAG: AAA family ATPase [Methylococcaceae bacterium]|nr:AAA family ATPase [Methylococcaceae bacterium]
MRAKPEEIYSTSTRFWPTPRNDDTENDIATIKKQFILIDNKKPGILAIYDRNLSFCEYIRNNVGTHEKLLELIKGAIYGVVIGIEDKLDTEDPHDKEWLDILGKAIADSAAKDRCTVIIPVDVLRKSGLDITVNGSLEQAVHQVVGCLHKEPIKSLFDKVCGHLVVLFRETLVVHVTMAKNGHLRRGVVHICPNFKRVMEAERSHYGWMPGKLSIMLTAIVKKLYHDRNGSRKVEEEKKVLLFYDSLTKALPLGIAACNFFFDKGFCNVETSGNGGTEVAPFDAFIESLDYQRRKELFEGSSKKKEFQLSRLEFSIKLNPREEKYNAVNDQGKPWSRIDNLFKEKTERNDEELLVHIVQKGIDKAIRRVPDNGVFTNEAFPTPTIRCPFAEFGNRKTFDEQEAREFYTLENLLRKYLTTPDWNKPLSIAVFGYPGTGKTSTVKEIIKNVNPKTESKPLEFNMAQFNSVEQLTEAFHKVQDLGLTEKECPVVIFDEFDAIYDHDKLGWLKFFLAPMQDGEFLGKTATYHIRRAIFVFIGGTHHTFKSFEDEKDTPGKNDIKNAKHGDFISRLQGHLDLKSINEEENPGKASIQDLVDPKRRSLLLRRAILLRSLLEKNAQPILKETKAKTSSYTWKEAHIHRKVITAFLYAERYKHGTRSMEAIIKMSRWINGEFVPASLPPIPQLEAHVDPKSFEEILTI